MHLSALLDLDVVALESEDELTVLLELNAPTPPTSAQRAPAALQVVLDRSGSMAGDRLEGAKLALTQLVDRLDPSDSFGLVAFDDSTVVVVPAGPLTDKAAVKQAIQAIYPGGSTDLSSGYLRGLQELQRVAGPTGGTLMLLSDGQANAGVTDPLQLQKVAIQATTSRITTSTLGLGLGYDEVLLAALARGGNGNALFAEDADTAVGLVAGEVDGLLEQVAQACSLRIRWTEHVSGAVVLNDLPTVGLPDGFVCELGSFYAGETRKLVIRLTIPGIPALGLLQVASCELLHVSLPDLVQHSATLPLHVNVVPGDQAAGRIANPVVRSEALFQEVQQAKKESGRLLREGRVDEASRLLRAASAGLSGYSGPLADELLSEVTSLNALAEESYVDPNRASKISTSYAANASRNRGRQTRGADLVLRWADGCGTGSDIQVPEWELQRWGRAIDPSLAAALRPGLEVRDELTAGALAVAIADPRLRAFFEGAMKWGGFTVERA